MIQRLRGTTEAATAVDMELMQSMVTGLEALFVGRERELNELEGRLSSGAARPVWVTGPAGIGKTALARMLAQKTNSQFPGGVSFLRANKLEDIPRTALHQVRRDPRAFLLVVDDVESRPHQSVGQELALLAKEYPSARVVVTSRDSPGHQEADREIRLGGLTLSEIRELLSKRIKAATSDALASEVFRTLGGNPLAVRTVADIVQLGRLSLPEVLGSLKDFSWTGVVDAAGEAVAPEEPIHRQIVSDVVAVSEEFLGLLKSNPELLYELSPRGFEKLVAEILGRLGYEVELTPKTRDGGRDITAAKRDHLGSFLYFVECKRYAPDHPVGVRLVRELNGVVQAERATAGILATTSYFTSDAREFQERMSFQLSLKDYLGIQHWLRSVQKGRSR